ncbi:MAG: hypothetical protein DCC55_14215 [Chloroflexi bacterium]|nr:MAG: hypothetical protein DCC55_14215 [Chloroflexota bacterium]
MRHLLFSKEQLRGSDQGADARERMPGTWHSCFDRLRARLGDVALELEWAKGGHLTTEQAIARALS